MTLIITPISNRKIAERAAQGHDPVEFVTPQHTRAIHGVDRVIIVGHYPHLERRYRGICPLEVIDPKPYQETIEPDDSDR